MTAKLLAAFGYQGDALNLPVADADGSAAFYVGTMGFAETERGGGPVKRVVVERVPRLYTLRNTIAEREDPAGIKAEPPKTKDTVETLF